MTLQGFLLSVAWFQFYLIAWTDFKSGGSFFLDHQASDIARWQIFLCVKWKTASLELAH